jgi:hypothetical protein
MQAFASIPHVRPPPEHRAQFLWIVETVTQRTNTLRGGTCLISARSLFDPRPGPYTKSPRLLTVFLARNLMGWPASAINAVFSPTSYPHSANLITQARQWVSSGCFDALSGRSMAPIKEHVLYASGSIFPAAPPNPAANEPPDPPPRRNPPEPKPAAREILRSKPRKRTAKAPSHSAGDEPRALPLPPDPPAKPVEMLEGQGALLPIRAAPIGLNDELIQAPFLRLLHPRLVKAASTVELSVRDFIADMIAEAIQQKARFSPLAPQAFLQVLSCASLDVPAHLVPHAQFIQRTLYDFAKLLPARDSLQAPAAIIRPVKPVVAAAGD